jgi:2-octaprenyl-6-methoxyphenol hydroxylase
MHDVIVAGAGLNGLTVALALSSYTARTPLDVLVLDAADPHRKVSAEMDRRGSAITDSSRNLLSAVGAWDQAEPFAARMMRVEVIDGPAGRAPVLLSFGSGKAGAAASIIENPHLLAAVREAAVRSPAIRIQGLSGIARLDHEPGSICVTTTGGDRHRARLLVAADGRSSPVRRMLGIETVGWSYGQSGIVLAIEHEHPHHGVAEERFLPSGPFATLPLPGNRSTLVWTETEARAREIVALDRVNLGVELEKRLNPRLGKLKDWSQVQAWPLELSLAKSLTTTRAALIGDTAHVIHPLAGLGYNLGVRDAAALAEVVTEAARDGRDVGASDVLERYASWRRADTLAVAATTDLLNRLFSNDNALLKMFRDAGLIAVDRLAPLKSVFVNEAAGFARHTPKLLNAEAL